MECLESYNDKVLQEDLEYIVKNNDSLSLFTEKTILVTGVTGLIGMQIVKTLLCLNRLKKTDVKIIALARNKEKVKNIYKDLLNRNELQFVYQDIKNEIIINQNIDYIIHCASETKSKVFVENPVETIDTTIYGTENILKLAYNKKIKSMVYLSSMEVYGIPDINLEFVKEENLGYIDILNVRSSYSEGKRMAECICASYAKEYNVPVKMARLAQTFGAGILEGENRVFAQFAKSAINKEDIILHTKGISEGNYCYTRDAINAIFILLQKGINGEAYNICNENSNITIKDMAEMVCKNIANNEIKVILDIFDDKINLGYAPNVKMHLSSKKMQALGWNFEIGLEESYRRMIDSIKSRR